MALMGYIARVRANAHLIGYFEENFNIHTGLLFHSIPLPFFTLSFPSSFLPFSSPSSPPLSSLHPPHSLEVGPLYSTERVWGVLGKC